MTCFSRTISSNNPAATSISNNNSFMFLPSHNVYRLIISKLKSCDLKILTAYYFNQRIYFYNWYINLKVIYFKVNS